MREVSFFSFVFFFKKVTNQDKKTFHTVITHTHTVDQSNLNIQATQINVLSLNPPLSVVGSMSNVLYPEQTCDCSIL